MAQTTIFTEDWETAAVGQTPPTGWGVDLVSGSNYTFFYASGTYPTCTPFSGTRFVEFQSWNASSGTINRLKRTSAVSTVGYSVVTVDFEWLVDPGYSNNDNVMVQWSTDGVTWNNTTSFSRYAATQAWILESVTLPAGAANVATLYLGLLFTSAYGDNCHLDLVHIKASAGPNISYTPFGNTSVTTARTLTTTIAAPSGIPTTGIGLPVLYWKKNAGAWTPATGVFVSGTTYTFTFGAGVVIGDVVSYYIVGQDLNSTPNLACAPSAGAAGLTANPPAAATAPTTPSSYTIIGQLCGNYNVGVGQTYTTITAALADLSNKEVTCPVTFTLTDNTYTETLPLLVYPFAGASSTNTVTLKPAAGKTPVISGSSASGVIVLYGCNYFIIDGSNSGGTDKSMTWENTNTAASTYTLGIFNNGTQGASNCTIKNCLIRASSQIANNTYAVILNYSGGGYNNIVINNNTIYSARYGMQFAGVAGNLASNGQITNNIFGSTIDAQAIQYNGMLLTYCDNTLIQGNEIMGAALGNANYGQSGIYLSTACTNTKIKQNSIHDWYYNGTGGWGNYGLYFATADATTPTEISNNLMFNIKGDGYSTTAATTLDVYGMFFSTGGNVKLYHNNINLSGSVTSSTYANYSACIGITSSCSNFDLRNNILKNSLQPVSGAPASKTFAIINGGTATMWSTINYNNYYVNGIGPNIGYQTSARVTLANWRTATTQDINSINIDPVFVSATDLHASAAGLMKTGIYLPTITVDYAGVNRTDPPDIGAYQFSANPLVTTTPAAIITTTGATLNGTINPSNATVTSGFEYGLTTAYGTSVAGAPVSVTGSTALAVSVTITGLAPCTLYHFRAKGTSGAVIVNGSDLTFTTANASPTVTPVAASTVTGTTATLNGTVNANTLSTVVTFDYGLTVAYGTTVAGVPSPVTGGSATAVSAAITGLIPGTTYHYRVNGANVCGTSNSTDMTFTTPALAPAIVTLAATGVTTNGATLNGTINANGASTTVTFDYGLTVAYGTTVAGTPSPVTGNSVTPVSTTVTGLATNTTYHFRVNGANSIGTANGGDLTFMTGCPLAAAAGTVTGPVNVCKNGTGYVYTVPAIANATTYNWTLPSGASITAGNNTNSITVSYSAAATSGNISVYGSSICGNGAVSPNLSVTVNAQPVPTVTGPATVCALSTGNVYTTQAGMTGYSWTVTGGVVTAGGTATSNTVTITWNATGTQTVCVNYTNAGGCTAAAPVCYTVTVNALPVPTVTGPVTLCAGTAGNVYTTQAGMTGYTWTVSAGGVITSGAGTNSITVTWNTAGAQTVCVNYANANGCVAVTPGCFNVTVNALPVPTIAGPASVCVNSAGNVYTTQAGMTGYNWTVSAGGLITAGSTTNAITVTWSTTGAKTVTVNYNNVNNCTASTPASYAVTVNALPVPTITGPATTCANSANNVYTTTAGMTNYVWTIGTGGVITAGGTATDNTVTVTWTTAGAKTVTVNFTNANGCTAAAATSFAVTVNPTPTPTIGSNNTPCVGSTGNMYYTEGGMTGYIWTVSAGGAIVSGQGTSAINVTWTGVGAQWVGVNYTNTSLCSAQTPSIYNLFVNPMPNAAGAITGTATLCAGTNGVAYSCGDILNASTYTWTLPAGATIATGAGTKNITVNFGATAVSGNITVAGTNSCGNGTASPAFAVTVNPLPAAAGTITGSASVCVDATGVTYSVPTIANAATYVWTVPAGATITAGAATKSITVSFGPTAGTGVVTVKGTNTCGNGAISSNFNVTMNAIPAAPVVTANGAVLTSSAAGGNQWYYAGNAIAGATNQTYTVTHNTGYYWCVVTTNGCASPISNKVWVVVTGQQELQGSNFNVYPVPNDGRFTVSITSPVQEAFTVQVFNQLGAKVFELNDLQVNGTVEKQVDLRPIANGIYSVVFLNSEHKVVKKVIVNK